MGSDQKLVQVDVTVGARLAVPPLILRNEMLRISTVERTEGEVVLKVEGWMSGEGIKVLEREGSHWLREGNRLILDLTGVQFIDEEGITLLRRWCGDRLVLRGGSPFLRSLLETYGLILTSGER